jgi:hypothetical protein
VRGRAPPRSPARRGAPSRGRSLKSRRKHLQEDPFMEKLHIIKLSDHEAPLFLADVRDREPFRFHPTNSLHWQYRMKGAAEWKDLPSAAVVEVEAPWQIVRLLPERLGTDGHPIQLKVYAEADPLEASDPFDYASGLAQPHHMRPFRVKDDGLTQAPGNTGSVEVTMNRTKVPVTKDEILASVIRASTNQLDLNKLFDFMDLVFTSVRRTQPLAPEQEQIARFLQIPTDPFPLAGADAYRVLTLATELFVLSNCGVIRGRPLELDTAEEEARFGHHLPKRLHEMWKEYLEPVPVGNGRELDVLPYLSLIRRKLGDISTVRSNAAGLIDRQAGLLQDKLLHPPMLELIWCYWIEESMAVQAFNSIVRRFQNLRAPGERDPLAALEIDPLRGVGNLLWAWTQDEQSRLSVLRRAHEYDHEYGFTLHGKAVADLRTADRRSKFLEAFHTLLGRASQFYKADDNTTVHADAFALLNSIKETHYILSQGASNQFPNIATTARIEMLTQLWILSRPEVREFLGTRVMVAYPEPWMDRVDTVKQLKGWTDTSVVHFRDLAVFGEQIVLHIRYGAWSIINDPDSAANWARYWRAEVQGYIHAYRAATGVDLSEDVPEQRAAESRFVAPSVHLRNRLLSQSAR